MKMWGNVLTIFTHKKMIKHVHEKVKSLFDFLSSCFDWCQWFLLCCKREWKGFKDYLSFVWHHTIISLTLCAIKIKRKRKHWGRTMIMLIRSFFLIFTILYLCFNATNAAVIKKSHVSWKLKKAVKEIKQNFRFHLQFYNKFIFTTCSFIEFHHHIMIGCLHALCVYVCMEMMFYI